MTGSTGAKVGPYRLGRLLGRGGMAVVYEATHETAGRTVALKLISPDRADPEFVERFRHEGRMQAVLDHPHVVTVYEAGESDSGPWLAMRLVRGMTLAQLIDDASLTAARTLDLLQQIASALDAAHAAGLVHRDVKPRNVLVEGDDRAYLADFGLTRSTDGDGPTAAGQFIGTIAYAAPEVVAGQTPGPAADRYALAAMLFQCLTCSPPFPRPTHSAVLFAHTHEPPPRVSGRREGVPAALDEVLATGLAKRPADRPRSAADLIARARAALTGIELGPPSPRIGFAAHDDGTTADQITLPTATAPAVSARRGRAALAAALAAGVLVGGAAVALLDDDRSASATAAGLSVEALPPAPEGTARIGPDLAAAGRTVTCDGEPLTEASPGCTIFQDRLPEATLVVPRDGVIRRWGVRSATGEFAVSVIRPRDDGYFQIARSDNEFVTGSDPTYFATDLAVQRGDRLALLVVDGSGLGVRAAPGATTGSWTPFLAGLVQPPRASVDGALLMQADLMPGGRVDPLGRLVGTAAARAPDGEILARERTRFANGRVVEARVVLVGDAGVLDIVRDGVRTARIGIPDMRGAVKDGVLEVGTYTEPSNAEQIGVYIRFSVGQSDRLHSHYFDVIGNTVRLT